MQLTLLLFIRFPQGGQRSGSGTYRHWWVCPAGLNRLNIFWCRDSRWPLSSPCCPNMILTRIIISSLRFSAVYFCPQKKRESSSFLSPSVPACCDNSICSASSRMNYGWKLQPLNVVRIYVDRVALRFITLPVTDSAWIRKRPWK